MASSSSPTKRNGKGKKVDTTPANKDKLWKDMLAHEKHLVHLWHWKWDFLQEPEFRCPFLKDSDDAGQREELTRIQLPAEYQNLFGEPSKIPEKSSAIIGWRPCTKNYNFDMHVTKPNRPPKLRFQDEQYGKYRNLKYLQEKEPDGYQQPPVKLPGKIRHSVKPLLC